MEIAPHQKAFADQSKPYTGLWHGTGCCKTRTALYTTRDCDGGILVIAPKTTVNKKQWQYEASVLGMKEPTVISKETFRRDHKMIPRFSAVIVDEAHYVFGVTPNTRYRNKQKIPKASQLYEALMWYVSTHSPDRLILATATPNKSPMAIWAASTLLGRTWDFYAFRHDFYTVLPMNLSYGQQVFAPKRDKASMERLANLTKSLGHVLRLEDIRDIPEQTFITEEFEPTAAQVKAIKELPQRFTGDATIRTKRHQIENGILYEDVFDPTSNKVTRRTEYFPNEKNDYIVERSYEFKKMVIFANYTAQVDKIAEALRNEGHLVFTLDSRTKDRKQVCDQAEASESAYIVAQASVSSEWEFKSCPCVIFASLSNRNVDYIQALGRVQRYDAVKKNIYIKLITCGKASIDKHWHDVIMSGRDFNEALHE